MTADEREVLAEAIPEFHAGNGAIRIFGQGDAASTDGRFKLAIARAGAVAEALAGYGVPASRIAVSVACADSAQRSSRVAAGSDTLKVGAR